VIQEPACVRLELDSRPENVAVVRAALAGLAEAAEFDGELETDLKTAVSEACNNVVLHAYRGGAGRMLVTAACELDRIDVVVADSGTGITRLSSAPGHMGLGLALISALADQAEFRSPSAGGAEVRMRFRRGVDGPDNGIAYREQWPARPAALTGDVVLWCDPVAVLRHVLGRVARAVAAMSHFTVSGATELYAINDAVAACAEAAADAEAGADGRVVIAVSGAAHRLTLDGWPFPAGAERGRLAALLDEISFESNASGGLLHMLLLDHGVRLPAPERGNAGSDGCQLQP